MLTNKEFTPLERHERDHVLRIAYRGASAYAPENSLEALHKAAEMQADMVELDIRITLDERPVIAHDATLKRLYKIEQHIDELTLKNLRSKTTTPKAEPIPTFEEAAFVCAANKVGLYLDIKAFSREAFEIIFETLRVYQLTNHVILGAFRPDWLAEIKARYPELKTSILFSSIYVNAVKLAESIQADYVHPCWEQVTPEPHRLLTPDWVQVIRDAGLSILTWHEERSAEIEALVRLGVDGICSDRPDLLAKLTPPQSSSQLPDLT